MRLYQAFHETHLERESDQTFLDFDIGCLRPGVAVILEIAGTLVKNVPKEDCIQSADKNIAGNKVSIKFNKYLLIDERWIQFCRICERETEHIKIRIEFEPEISMWRGFVAEICTKCGTKRSILKWT